MTIKRWHALIELSGQSPGIYSVWSDTKLIYIGTALILYKRLRTHPLRNAFFAHGVTEIRTIATSMHEWDQWRYKVIRLNMERWLIEKHKPVLNIMYAKDCSMEVRQANRANELPN